MMLKTFFGVLVTLLAITLVIAGYQYWRALPAGLSMVSPWHEDANPQLLYDTTFVRADGNRVMHQEIFDETLQLIQHAQHLIVLDMFLFNAFGADQVAESRPLSSQLTQALITRQQAEPALRIVLITDPFNRLYGGLPSAQFAALEAAGIEVLETPLNPLKDSNPSWSAFWRLCCQWLGNSMQGGWLPNPVGPGKVTLRSYLSLLNFKANHRKVLIADNQGHWTALVSSANPHDASSLHSNIAVRFSGPAVADLLTTENAVLALAGRQPLLLPTLAQHAQPLPAAEQARLRILTEGKIRDAILTMLDRAEPGDEIGLEIFYLSHQPIIQALQQAQQRGVQVRVLLDPSKDAFGRQKNGVPNRQSAWQLTQAGVALRFCNTHGEQCHSKLIWHRNSSQQLRVITGSANFTRRNLDDLNLETDVELLFPPQHPQAQQLLAHFERRWQNHDGELHSVDYARYADHSRWRYALARLMEWSGWSAF